uniref:Jasmonate O-methyltransferase n=1 Tax=Kalanchoe fedtschenkoi TaxID=63787 RepID=A0A7N1A3Z7_KALFE
MVLSFMGRSSPDSTSMDAGCQWELLAEALMSMVYDGLIDEEKVDTFNAPYYAPCLEEVQLVVEKEGSFTISRVEVLEVYWDKTNYKASSSSRSPTTPKPDHQSDTLRSEKLAVGQQVAKAHRAVVESMFHSHFGTNDDAMN